MKRVIKCVSLLICSVFLLLCFVFPVACLDYSADSPSYISESGNFYIEVNTVEIGRGTIILPNNYKYDYLSTYDNSDELYNSTSSTLNGYIITTRGNRYQCRFSSFSPAQYYLGTGVGYGWQDLSISELYTSNGSILGSNGQKVYNVPDSDRIIISIVIIACLLYLIFTAVVMILRKRSDY